jgi:serum/glucocorticoid-regulated kinase 2
MLHKNPARRITISQIKKHPFFKEIDWQKLIARQLKPPLHLSMDNYTNESESIADADEAAFLQNASSKRKPKPFKDTDYNEENQLVNRVRQFTFAGDNADLV